MSTDAKAVTADLRAIAAQANARGFRDAVEQLAADMEEILPTLSRPSQDAVQKSVTDLSKATSESSPGGTSISPSERLALTNDWVVLGTSTGATQQQLDAITTDLAAALAALEGIVTIAPIELSDFLDTITGDANFEAEAPGCRVRTFGCELFRMYGDRELLRETLENVIRNAIRYSPQGNDVELDAFAPAEGGYRITVRDHGPGVAADHGASLFESFRRAPQVDAKSPPASDSDWPSPSAPWSCTTGPSWAVTAPTAVSRW